MSSRSSCRTRRFQVRLGLLQELEAHAERAGFPGLCREHHRARHSAAALPKQPDILQVRAEDSKKIVIVLPREGWFEKIPSQAAVTMGC